MDDVRTSRAGNLVVIGVFLALLFTPLVLALTGHMRVDTDFLYHTEGRDPFVAPPISSGALATGGYERDLERQIADAFPLRTQLIEAYAYPRFVWLGESSSPEVVRGRDGWLFYRGSDEADYVLHWRPSDAELRHIAAIYAHRARWCERRGIRYLFYIAPNKTSIYPDEAPAWYRPAAPTPMDRLLPMLRAAGVATVDVRPALIAAAREGEVYSRGDTHWNGVGGYVAYREIVAALHDAGVRDRVVPTGRHPGTMHADLLGLSGVGRLLLTPTVDVDFPRHAVPVGAPEYAQRAAADEIALTAYTVADPRLPKAILSGDSFSRVVDPYLQEDFRRTLELQQHLPTTPHFDRSIIAAEHPDIVIQELVERSLTVGAKFVP